MPADPLTRLARERARLRAVADMVDIEMQMSGSVEFRPVVTILRRARNEAAEALVALSFVDVSKPELVRELQNIVARFDNLIRWVREIINEGKDAEAENTNVEREELLSYLMESGEEDEARVLGLLEGRPNADA